MKLYDGGKIFLGLIVFVAFATFPFYYKVVSGVEVKKPDPKTDTPAIQEFEKQYGKKQCVESKEFMRTEHMQLLNNWRDSVVREGNRGYMGDDGTRRFNMSLQNECLKCHSNKKKFCDECHNYMAVKPYCFDCHIAPKEEEKS
jgi:hypothetical protein